MYAYTWDPETGGLLLNSTHQQFSKEPRPVYYCPRYPRIDPLALLEN